jgi:MFS family permease
MGVLQSCFFWTYVPAMFLVGWLQERINAYRTLALGLGLWALATVLTGFAGGFAMLLALRLTLGLGESAVFPCSSKLIAQHLPQHRLGAANGLVSLGIALGPAFGTFAGGLLMAEVGWRWLFILFGLVSALWLVPWLLTTRKLSREADAPAADHGEAPSFGAILARRDLWGVSLGHFSGCYALYFILAWLPTYLIKIHGFSVPQMAQIGGVVYLVYGASVLLTGWLSDVWMRAGASANLVRKTFGVACGLVGAVALPIAASPSSEIAIGALCAAAFAFGLSTPMLYATGQTLAGPRAGGKWISVQNAIGNLAGIVGPIVTGRIVDLTGSFDAAFWLAGVASLLGAVGFGLVIRKVAPLTWTQRTSA